MGFLIRVAFWLSLVFLLVPLDVGERVAEHHQSVSPLQALFAAREAVQDVAGICERQPDVCATAKAAFATILARARESMRLAQAWTDKEAASASAPVPAEKVPPAAEPESTGSITRAQ